MSWFDDVSTHIINHLEEYATVILKAQSLQKTGKTIFVNSCPFCGHDDCFTLTRGQNVGYCHSCGQGGTLIQIAQKVYGEIEGIELLAEWSGKKYTFAGFNPEKAEAREKFVRFQRMCQKAVEFYYNQLLKNEKVFNSIENSAPGTFQKDVRRHTGEGIKKYKVGYSGNWKELRQSLLDEGYTEEEIKRAGQLISFPPGYFVYPYYDLKGNLIRINGKLFIRYCKGSTRKEGGYTYDCDVKYHDLDKFVMTAHENQSGHSMNFDNTSRGDKEEAFFFHVKDMQKKKKKYGILVEGENDVISTDETLQLLPDSYKSNFVVIGIGGNSPEGMFNSDLLRQFDAIYECFDNDDAGNKYREQLDKEMPDVIVNHMKLPSDFNDIDEYLKICEPEEAGERLKELIDRAEFVNTKHFKLFREGKYHHWEIKNRHYGLRYEIDFYQIQKNGFKGSLLIFKNGFQTDKKVGDIDACKVSGEEMLRLKTALSNKIQGYYNDIRWVKEEPERPFDELLDIFHCSKEKTAIIKQLAWYIFHAQGKEYEEKIKQVQYKVRIQNDIDMVLKEVNGFENREIDVYTNHPVIKLAQSFFPENRDGYLYFVKTIQDGESAKRVPCLLSNKKREIRLDFMKKKTTQSLLLIENKYELPVEVETNFINVNNLSLQYKWVDDWLNDRIPDEDLDPAKIIGEIEEFIRKTYYTTDDVVKVLALWIYATYFYSLFQAGFPYLQFTGAKGTGKSTLDDIIALLAFNPTFAVSISGPALYRQVGIFGGTFILDEQENLVDSNKVNESDMAAILKGGYANKGEVIRFSKDNGTNESFTPFCPKVISNINGLDSVIGDRCIVITTYQAPEEKVKQLIKTEIFKGKRRQEVYDLSSRAALSALVHFCNVDYQANLDNRMDTGSLRLTQILEPLITIARVVGGDYEEHLKNFYQSTIQTNKEESALDTLEGKVKHILVSASEEILGHAKHRWVLNANHVYEKEISVDRVTLNFDMDSMHLKVLVEELENDTSKNYTFKEIHSAIKNVMPRGWENKTKTRITITDPDMIRNMQGKKYPHGMRFTFNAREFITKQQEIIRYKEDASESLF